jgi:hypothetical protein
MHNRTAFLGVLQALALEKDTMWSNPCVTFFAIVGSNVFHCWNTLLCKLSCTTLVQEWPKTIVILGHMSVGMA